MIGQNVLQGDVKVRVGVCWRRGGVEDLGEFGDHIEEVDV